MRRRPQCYRLLDKTTPQVHRLRFSKKSIPAKLFCLVLLLVWTTSASANITFEKYDVKVGSANQPTVLTGFFLEGDIADLAVVEFAKNGKNRLRIYAFDNDNWKPKLEAQLRDGVQFVDKVNLGGRDRLITYEDGRLSWFDTVSASERELVAITSGLQLPRVDEIPHINITKDVNGDDLDDLVFPGTDGFRVLVQTRNSTFANPVKIGTSEKMDMTLEPDLYRHDPWAQGRVHEIDYNRDGRGDLVYWDNNCFKVHLQNENGLFSESTETFTTDVAFDSDDIKSLAAPYGIRHRRKDHQPEGKLTGRVLDSLTDANGDGTADLVIFSLQGGSLWKMDSTCEVYFGTPTANGGTEFNPNADAVIESDGIPFNAEKYDFDGDGQADFTFTLINPSFFKVARMLIGFVFTRSMSFDLHFYQMGGGLYPNKPTVRRKIKTVSLGDPGDGATNIPAPLFGDVNGDKRLDMLVQKGQKELHVFVGVPKPNLFAKRSQKVKVAMPKNKKYTWLTDLNNDGKQDVLMYQTPKNEPNRITVLVSK